MGLAVVGGANDSDKIAGRGARPQLALLVAVVAISFAAIFFRLASPTSALLVATGRLCIASLLYLPFSLRARSRLRPNALRLAVLGGFFYALHFGSWATSLELTSVAASVSLVTATPLLLATVAVFTKRDVPSRLQYVAIAIGVVGILVIARADTDAAGALTGDAFALVGAVAMAGYLLAVRRVGYDFDVLAFSGVATAVAAVVLLIVTAGLGKLEMPPARALMYMGLLALIPQLIGHLLMTWALRRVTPTVVGMATVGEPAVSTLLAFLWLGEEVATATLIGCAITAFAVLLALRAKPAR